LALDWNAYADMCTRGVRDHIGIEATYTPTATGVPVPLRAPFDDPYFSMVLQGGQPMSVEAPAIDVRLADLPLPPEQGDVVVLSRPGVGQATFRVEDARPGGQGTSKLFLSLAV